MEIRYRCFCGAVCCLMLFVSTVKAQDADWRDKLPLLVYSPRYFGPSAFPMPEVRMGKVSSEFEFEIRGEYHHYTGDQTSDLFLRGILPFVRGKAALEISFLAWEKYKMTTETMEERNAADTECPSNVKYNGDVIVSALYQLLEDEDWFDAMISLNLKTASGGRLVDARFTDAATYWFDINASRYIARSFEGSYWLRLQATTGFYCWMTNSLVHRQNDAWHYGVGLGLGLDMVTVMTDISGFNGYDHNGDNPLIWRNNIQLNLDNFAISLRFNHGIRDYLYNTYSIGLMVRF